MPESDAFRRKLLEEIQGIRDGELDHVALKVFRYQSDNNPIYMEFLKLVGCNPSHVDEIFRIPFLPVSVFKQHLVQSGHWAPERIFLSTGTTGKNRARHAIRSMKWYHALSGQTFEENYGSLHEYAIIALLPHYIRQKDSSLIEMIASFIKAGRSESSGFFLDNFEDLHQQLSKNIARGQKTLLFGVSYALLDFAFQYTLKLPDFVIVMETGGMKGRREEMIRGELHSKLSEKLGADHIHSEYGMTEMISQAYSAGSGMFKPAQQMKVLIREINDPFTWCPSGKTGVIQVIDLGNIDTCSFIATEDIGRIETDSTFSVLGRLDNSDIRGCTLFYP